MKYTAKELDAMPTLATGQAEDLKIDNDNTRVWLSRVEPGMVSIEMYDGERWTVTEEYPG